MERKMEQKKKNTILTGLIYLILFAAYNLVVFLLFKGYNQVFWVSYGFMIAAYLIHIACVYFILKNLSVNAVFFGIPLASFSIYFVCAELFCSFVFMIFRNRASVNAAIGIQALLLAVFLVIAIVSIMARDAVQNTDTKIKEKVNFIKGINIDIEMLLQRCSDPQTMAALKKLSETIKYSDPMSNSSVAIQEQMIMQHMMELRTSFDAGDMKAVQKLCAETGQLFCERNKKLMISK